MSHDKPHIETESHYILHGFGQSSSKKRTFSRARLNQPGARATELLRNPIACAPGWLDQKLPLLRGFVTGDVLQQAFTAFAVDFRLLESIHPEWGEIVDLKDQL